MAMETAAPAGREFRPFGVIPEPFQRLARHWFVFIVLVGLPAWAIYGGLLSYGLPLLLRDDPALFQDKDTFGELLQAVVNSPSFFTHLSATFFTGMFWLLAAIMGDKDERRFARYSFGEEISYLFIRTAPISIFMIVLAAFPRTGVPAVQGAELIRCLIGAALGFLAIAFFAGVSGQLSRVSGFRQRYVLFLMLSSIVVTLHFWPKLLPIVSIYKLAITISLIYFFINFFEEGTRLWVFLLAVGLPLWIGTLGGFKYTFNGMEDLYDCPVKLLPRRLGLAEQPTLDTTCEGVGVGPPPLRSQPIEALTSFEERKKKEGALGSRLVIVAASGGAYRATFWTALVLDRLREMSGGGAVPGLPDHIRLVTGASGGMVGASYFALLPRAELDHPERISLVQLVEKDIEARQRAEGLKVYIQLPRDSLTSVTQQLAVHDILHIGLPGRLGPMWGSFPNDRGRVLQKDWGSLDVPFSTFKTDVDAGNAPSMIFSPTVVETGQPLLISDLNLTEIADDQRLSRRSFRQRKSDETVAVNAPRHTIDFFRAFPKTFKTFTLQTAARMSSAFPYVSPAVDLPTEPARRVVDAGYFDNYGMTTALIYLRRPEVREWMRRNGMKGAILIQINAFPTLNEYTPAPAPATGDCYDDDPIESSRAFQWLDTPFVGLTSSQLRSMVFRSEQALAALQDIYKGEGLELSRVAFENTARSSFSWYLPTKQLECMRAELDLEHNKSKFEELTGLWAGTMTQQEN